MSLRNLYHLHDSKQKYSLLEINQERINNNVLRLRKSSPSQSDHSPPNISQFESRNPKFPRSQKNIKRSRIIQQTTQHRLQFTNFKSHRSTSQKAIMDKLSQHNIIDRFRYCLLIRLHASKQIDKKIQKRNDRSSPFLAS